MISTKILYNAVFKTDEVNDIHKFQPLPQPSGSYPYRLELAREVALKNPERMVFHMVGDTGGSKPGDLQRQVAGKMAAQYLLATEEKDRPAFLYHLGDIVYHYGEAEQYNDQFLKPFESYPGPIFAIAGNHDSDVNPESEAHYESLEAFYTAFCNTCPKTIYFGPDGGRKSQVQPHVYWTMQAPLATVIGLHTNVPKYGHIKEEQRNWFIKELQHAARFHPDKAIIVCMHHAPYSADVNHGSSLPMIEFLDSAYEEAGVKPDIVFSGHVHNYQRFNKQYNDGKTVPYIVAGAGGFDELHQLANPYDPMFCMESKLLNQVQLENYCDNRHGFLKVAVDKDADGLRISGEYYTIPQQNTIEGPVLFDHFTVNLAGR
ncbi:metallophosphoesterase family protein [Pedobacter metabolipauper]|uniref:3',5'-cyclic AMP phosphodiesterase CpdA n=1 Tax=Pedobacter metabolipauper TaxID=425513 RepID=A0A4R6SZU8_9SPHI|nr:metallophosphoesterase [Pedobacter metabolipauper]TDQ10292.1 3',5'-cyclic AMP phosphodiesterase CpdA [Pedobacter metabolipauper]